MLRAAIAAAASGKQWRRALNIFQVRAAGEGHARMGSDQGRSEQWCRTGLGLGLGLGLSGAGAQLGVSLRGHPTSCGCKLTPPFLLQELEEFGTPDARSYTALITALEFSGKAEMALGLLQRMLAEGVAPNLFTFNACMKACTQLRDLDQVCGRSTACVIKPPVWLDRRRWNHPFGFVGFSSLLSLSEPARCDLPST